MLNFFGIRNSKKAGIIACFFLLTQIGLRANDKLWLFNPELQKAYQLVLNLQPDAALAQIAKVTDKTDDFHKTYLLGLNETIDVLITEDPKKFETLLINFKHRLEWLEKLEPGPEVLFLRAELNLQK
ncbi:MAG: hypothetical protein ACKO96_29095, partial [Flammeovirgaceae bacterium]